MATGKQNIEISVSVLDKFSRPFAVLAQELRATGSQIKSFGQTASLAITAPMLLAGATFVKAASDAAEMENRFRAVFGDLSDSAAQFADELGNAVGRSDISIQNSLATFQGYAVGLGLSREAAQQFSQSIATLSLDFASFNNISDGEAQQRFIAALSGSSEVLDQFGINIKEAAIEGELQRLGMTKSSQAASEQEKTIARLSLIMKAMTQQGAVGDAIRTQDSFANQMKRLTDAFFEFKVQLGRDIIPALTGLVTAAGNALKWFGGLDEGTRKLIMAFAGFAAVIGPATFLVGGAITTFAKLSAAVTALRVASLALLGPWGLVVAAVGTVAGVIGYNLYNATEKTTEVTSDMKDQIAALAPNFDKASLEAGNFAGSLTGMADQAKKSAEAIKKLNEEAAGIFQDVAKDEAASKKDIAEAIIGQEQKVSQIKQELREAERDLRKAEDGDNKRSLEERVATLNEKLTIERNALRTAADLKKSLRVEVQEAERRADLTDFERMIEDIHARRVERLKAQLERLTEIKAEIAAEEAKNASIVASNASAQKKIREEVTATTDHVIKQATEQEQALNKVIAKMDNLALGGSSNSTAAFSSKVTKSSGGGSWGGGKANGGPVSPTKTYLVGENGPEIFKPDMGGTIIPNKGGGGNTYIVNVNGGTYLSDDAAEQMGDLIMKRLKLSNAI